MTKKKRTGMGRVLGASADRADEILREREAELLRNTTIDWEKLRPEIGDEELYNRLLAEVQTATERNESVGQLLSRLRQLGAHGQALFERAKKLLLP